MNILGILLILIGIILCCLYGYKVKHQIQIDKETEQYNNSLQNIKQALDVSLNLMKERNESLREEIDKNSSVLDQLLKNRENDSQKAYENFCKILDYGYIKKQTEYDNLIRQLKISYDNIQNDEMKQIQKVQEELDKIKETRAAAMEAILREDEIQAQLEFYCLQCNEQEQNDIKILEGIKPRMKNERVICKLIWSDYYQKQMTQLCNRVLQTTSMVTGIYRITNIKNKKCYIGQSADIADRWKQHAKYGCGIDMPAANKLYKAMQEDGLWNFSWEILEQCPREQLNEKEKFYIDLYDSYNFGYNSNKGIG